jgi:hypothetical protein
MSVLKMEAKTFSESLVSVYLIYTVSHSVVVAFKIPFEKFFLLKKMFNETFEIGVNCYVSYKESNGTLELINLL